MLAFVIEDRFTQTERKAFLSPLATASHRQAGCNRAIPRDIKLLMDLYAWNIFKATRECLMVTREAMAERLNIAAATYAAIEDELLTLCEWTGPALDAAVLNFFHEKTARLSYLG